jgi:hypothetical protein
MDRRTTCYIHRLIEFWDAILSVDLPIFSDSDGTLIAVCGKVGDAHPTEV